MGNKNILNKYFKYFIYFYRYLKFRVFIALGLNLIIGLLDGISLALFIPLFKLITKNTETQTETQNLDFISEFIINEVGVEPTLLNLFLLIFFLFCLKGVAKFLESYVRVLYQQIFMREIRLNNIDLFNQFDFREFIKADKGRIENTFSGEVSRVNMAYVYYFRSLQYGMLVLVYGLLAFGSDWKFTLIVILGGGLSNLLFNFFYKRTQGLSHKFTEESHFFLNLIVQKVHLFKYLKATGLNEKYGNKLKKNIFKMERIQLRLGLINAILGGIREPLGILIVFTAIFINIYLFEELIGAMLLSLILLYRAISFFIAFQEQWNVFLGVSGSLNNMQKFETELAMGKERDGEVKFHGFRKQMTFKDVSFEFESGKSILSNVSFELNKNETLAIIGESGSGKSTLMNLATGLLLPTEGDVLIDGKSISTLNLNSYKNHLGYIVQDATIFNDTIFNNITFWAPKTEENYRRFKESIKKAVISEFVGGLPEKENTILGANGINISGGQRQRLSIARELFKEVDFLFMDEATSSLDGETEAVIQDNIKALKGHYTIVIIAHRLATIKNVDRIIILHNGRIEATGSYEELYERSSRFRYMIEVQNL